MLLGKMMTLYTEHMLAENCSNISLKPIKRVIHQLLENSFPMLVILLK